LMVQLNLLVLDVFQNVRNWNRSQFQHPSKQSQRYVFTNALPLNQSFLMVQSNLLIPNVFPSVNY
jgi:hypothetical protein